MLTQFSWFTKQIFEPKQKEVLTVFFKLAVYKSFSNFEFFYIVSNKFECIMYYFSTSLLQILSFVFHLVEIFLKLDLKKKKFIGISLFQSISKSFFNCYFMVYHIVKQIFHGKTLMCVNIKSNFYMG